MNGYKLSKANNIIFANNQITDLKLGNNTIWNPNLNNTSFNLFPIVMDSDANLRLTWNTSYPTQGNSTFIIKSSDNIKMSDIDIIHESNGGGTVAISKIDDFCLYANRYAGVNNWPGGSSNAIFEENVILKFNNYSLPMKFYANGDENNRTFIAGTYVNKVIKSPSKGCSGTIDINFYPYNFDDIFYSMSLFDMHLVDYNDSENNRRNLYLWNNDNKKFTHISNGNIIDLNDTIFSSLNITYSGLKGHIEYTIKPNNTQEFKDIALRINDAMIHFIQEPYSNHRIYLKYFTRKINRSYLESNNSNEYMFHWCGSKIISRPIELKFDYSCDVLLPETLEIEYNIIMNGSITLDESSGNFLWDNLSFKHYKCLANSKIIFKRK